jgi:predicted ATPase
MTLAERLADVLAEYMRRPEYPYTPGLLAKRSGVPKATIVNWLEGRVEKPRRWQDLARVAAVLRLSAADASRLLQAGGYPPVARLHADVAAQEDRVLLSVWMEEAHPASTAPRTLRATNLPTPATPLIGREREIAAACALLQRPDVRLLTLSGPGGIGKTRLSIQVAAELALEREGRRTFADGVVFVPLAPISDAGLVATTIAQTLGITEEGGSQPLRDRLVAFLRDRHILLLLDNFEQVLAAGPLVAELIVAAPQLKALITSRAVLHISGEWEFAVPPLTLPDAHLLAGEADLESGLFRYEAVRLFVERVQAVQPDFALTATNARIVAEICHRLDGLPLAIELAAARGKLLSPKTLLARLEHRLGLLTGGARDLPPRQQTLRNTIDWSHGLLDAAEQQLFARLAVFVGGWTLEAAEAVCAELRIENEELRNDDPSAAILNSQFSILNLLESLVDKQMVRRETRADGEPRFVMLETIREYAIEQLLASGELDTTRQRHAQCFLALAEAAEPHLQHAEQQEWLDWLGRLDAEYDNLRAALDWSLNGGDAAIGLRLAGALAEFWWTRGYISEGRRWMTRAIDLDPAAATALRAKVLARIGTLAQVQGDHHQAATLCEAAVGLYRQTGPRRDLAWALRYLGYVLWEQGSYSAARAQLEESLGLCRELGDLQGGARALHLLGFVALSQGDYGQAMAYLATGLALCQQIGYAPVVANSLSDLVGVVARYQGDYVRAALLLESSLARFRESGYKRGIAMTTYHLGFVARAGMDDARATALFVESLRLRQELGDRRGVAECLEAMAGLAVAQNQPERAARFCGAAAALREALRIPIRPIDQPEHERILAAARAQLDEAAFAAAWEAGRTMAPGRLYDLVADTLPDHQRTGRD